jgi:hypothetical protein
MGKKVCSKCKEEKEVCEFGKKITNKDGLQSRCKECRKIETKEYFNKYPNRNKEIWEKNKNELSERYKQWSEKNSNYFKSWRLENKEKINTQRRELYSLNKEKVKEKRKEWRLKNKDIISQKTKEYREKNRELINERRRKKRQENLEEYRRMEREILKKNEHLKLIGNYRTRIKNYMKFNKVSIGTGTLDLVGLSSQELKDYLESKFDENMSWDNYGLHGWHIDHIIPLSSAKTVDELKKLCHYTNLQPLWSKDNLSKGNKF